MESPEGTQTCTGCRKAKPVEDFRRFNRQNLTCNACSERHRTRKNKDKANAAAAAKAAAASTDAVQQTATTAATPKQE
ncbi:hypothetical protein Tdes44962_MAKER01513 [Teratosphaeria destructans]|uniref:GATA-type domain-containing protein n=1 Tax=Teratosphaeria destructans TaxID=418781 RepID=A0A9W7SZY4_9PEZI|nr:hypothetical protein Tdes44962_MAKER01513 [Teratosphaeria destructans]